MTIFQDLLYQTTQGATGPGDGRGGVNASQVGLGVRVAAIETIHTQGFMQFTGNRTDMMISGDGFFVFRDGGSNIFSRAGNFTLDANFDLVHSGTGFRVQGFQMQRDPMNPMDFVMNPALSDIRIPLGEKMDPRATSVVGLRCNLDSRSRSFLPIGFKDIPFGGQGNPAIITHNVGAGAGLRNTLTIETDHTDHTEYLTFTFDTSPPTSAESIVFEMTGINAQGRPILNPTSATMLVPGSDPAITADVDFNSETGVLVLRHPTNNSTLWETNVYEGMNYFVFEAVDSNNDRFRFSMEFDESELGSSPVNATIWFAEVGTGGATIAGTVDGPISIQIPMKADGTFDLPTAGSTLASLLAPSATFPTIGTLTGEHLQLRLSANGSGFEVFSSNDPAPAPPAGSFSSVGSLVMGQPRQTKFTIFDCQGFPHTLEVQFKKVTENVWRWEAFFPENPSLVAFRPSGLLEFGPCGRLVSPNPGFETLEMPFSLLGRNNTMVRLDFSGYSFNDDAGGITQFASAHTTVAFFQDGFTMGVLNDFTVGLDGTIVGQFTNGQNMPIFRLALAQFANPGGLEKIGDTMFRDSTNSGLPNIQAAQEGGSGSIIGSTLEMSNVDLTEEFTRLIISQRGFQANTRIVTVSDSILEEVVNMKR